MRLGVTLLVLALAPLAAHGAVTINEIDSNQPNEDTREFIELYDGGIGNISLARHFLVLFNGANGAAYASFDLSAFQTNQDGFFVAGSSQVNPAPSLVLEDAVLQNGPDAVALYMVPIGQQAPEMVSTQHLVTAVVYSNSASTSPHLALLIQEGGTQVNENGLGNSDAVSAQACPEGDGFRLGAPMPGGPNLCPLIPEMLINELDCDQADADAGEFIELYDGGKGNTNLDGLVVVLYNGATDSVYAAYDLAGHTTGDDGYFLIGNPNTIPGISIAPSTIQNGPDAVAIYGASAATFTNGSPINTDNLIDAVVYGTDDPADTELLQLLPLGQQQADEGDGTTSGSNSIQRCPNGGGLPFDMAAFTTNPPSPGSDNFCLGNPPVAAFHHDPAIITMGAEVQFISDSTGAGLSHAWTFQDATLGASTSASPIITFHSPGEKFVTLTVSNQVGSDQHGELVLVSPIPEGEGEAAPEGEEEGEPQGEGEGEGPPEGEGAGEETPDGEGDAEGAPEGEIDPARISPILHGFAFSDVNNDHKLSFNDARFNSPDLTESEFNRIDSNDDAFLTVAELIQFAPGILHSGDASGDKTLGFGELLRIIQLYHATGYACAALPGATEDGFLPRPLLESDPSCQLHSADTTVDLVLSLSELLRTIQVYTFGRYEACPAESEDGFCPD